MQEGFVFRVADINDLELLVKMRIEVLKSANCLDNDTNMSLVEETTREYYLECFNNDTHIAYLAFDDNLCVGCGAVCFYKVMPTYHNISGERAYIMNMYTNPNYRRKGIAYKILDILIYEIKKRGVSIICLEATETGKPLYLKYGFVNSKTEMELMS